MRYLKRHSLFREHALCPHDPLSNGRLCHKERSRDLLGGKATQQTECQRNAPLGGKNGMTGDEDQTEEVITNIVIERGIEILHRGVLRSLELAPQLRMLALDQLGTT